MKLLLIALMILHGLLHLIGASAALHIALSIKLTDRSLRYGWLSACLLFLFTSLLYALNKEGWWILGIVAVLLSQYLILQEWADAKYGTISNLLILVLILTGIGRWRF